MKNHKKWLLSVILFSTLLLPLGVHAQDGETEVTETETTSLVTTTEETEVSAEETVDSPRSEVEIEEVIVPPTDEAPSADDGDIKDMSIPEYIHGLDDRKLISDTSRTPYRQSVVIHVYRKGEVGFGLGSGVLIAPNKVLTAAHVIKDVKTNAISDYVVVTPARNGTNRPYGEIKGSTYHFFTSFLRETSPGYSGAKQYDDLAVITLDSSFGSDVGYLPYVDSLTLGQPLTVIGYPGDKQTKYHRYMYESKGEVLSISDKLIEYRNDTYGGNSGGPVFDEQNRIVAIHVGGVRKDSPNSTNGANAGRRINTEALTLIQSALDNKKPASGISNSMPIYHLYNVSTGQHFYTTSNNEKNVLVNRGWSDKGVIWRTDTVGTPVYRLYHPVQKRYLYTANVNEKNNLPKSGWRNEGTAWYGAGIGKVYRFYNPSTKQHVYTSNEAEKDSLQANGFKNEGIAWSIE